MEHAQPATASAPSIVPCEQCAKLQRVLTNMRQEILRGARVREELKRSLESHDGAAGYWRRMAKASKGLCEVAKMWHGDPLVGKAIERHEQLITETAARFEQIDAAKMRLWEFWTGLSEDDATRNALRDIWSDL